MFNVIPTYSHVQVVRAMLGSVGATFTFVPPSQWASVSNSGRVMAVITEKKTRWQAGNIYPLFANGRAVLVRSDWRAISFPARSLIARAVEQRAYTVAERPRFIGYTRLGAGVWQPLRARITAIEQYSGLSHVPRQKLDLLGRVRWENEAPLPPIGADVWWLEFEIVSQEG